ncbi:hypothetical protein SCT_0386 [Sulfuricella sp. T08]|nr:hypothetical protein SCT_0386 [Sulfuricella sp. T08]
MHIKNVVSHHGENWIVEDGVRLERQPKHDEHEKGETSEQLGVPVLNYKK